MTIVINFYFGDYLVKLDFYDIHLVNCLFCVSPLTLLFVSSFETVLGISGWPQTQSLAGGGLQLIFQLLTPEL